MSDLQNASNSNPVGNWSASYAGSVVLITGGTSGIGYEIAKRFLEVGASVAITGTNIERGKKAEQNLIEVFSPNKEVMVKFYPSDVSSRKQMDAVIEDVKRDFGRLDVLICSAGIGRKASLLETPEEDLSKLLQVNVQGVIVSVQAATSLLERSKGNIVILSSDAGQVGEQKIGAYSVTKAAVNMATKLLALDLADRGIRVNAVAPGNIVPGMKSMVRVGETSDRSPEDHLSWSNPPIGRLGQAQDVAESVLYLASGGASFITGSILLIDGGMQAGLR